MDPELLKQLVELKKTLFDNAHYDIFSKTMDAHVRELLLEVQNMKSVDLKDEIPEITPEELEKQLFRAEPALGTIAQKREDLKPAAKEYAEKYQELQSLNKQELEDLLSKGKELKKQFKDLEKDTTEIYDKWIKHKNDNNPNISQDVMSNLVTLLTSWKKNAEESVKFLTESISQIEHRISEIDQVDDKEERLDNRIAKLELKWDDTVKDLSKTFEKFLEDNEKVRVMHKDFRAITETIFKEIQKTPVNQDTIKSENEKLLQKSILQSERFKKIKASVKDLQDKHDKEQSIVKKLERRLARYSQHKDKSQAQLIIRIKEQLERFKNDYTSLLSYVENLKDVETRINKILTEITNKIQETIAKPDPGKEFKSIQTQSWSKLTGFEKDLTSRLETTIKKQQALSIMHAEINRDFYSLRRAAKEENS